MHAVRIEDLVSIVLMRQLEFTINNISNTLPAVVCDGVPFFLKYFPSVQGKITHVRHRYHQLRS
jgi:hypothetical protein